MKKFACVHIFDNPRYRAGYAARQLASLLPANDRLERSDLDRARHNTDPDHAATDNVAAVREILSPESSIGPRVLRRARVRLE